MKLRKTHWTLSAGALAMSLALAGCGGGGSSSSSGLDNTPPPRPMVHTVNLNGSTDLMAGMTTIPAGTSITVGYTTVDCAEGGADCELSVSKDEVTGLYSATSTGGMAMVSVMQPPATMTVDLMGSPDLMAGTTTISAGMSQTVGNTTLSCAAGEDCEVTVELDAVTGQYSAVSTGMLTVAYDPPPVPVALDLPTVNTLLAVLGSSNTETLTIAAGMTETRGGVEFSCPAGGEDCVVTITNNLGVAEAGVTGGMAMASQVPVVIALPEVHDLMDGTFTVPAGETMTHGGVMFMCPAGGEDCVVTVTGSGAMAMASFTGGSAGAMVGTEQETPEGTQMLVDLGAHLRTMFDSRGVPIGNDGLDDTVDNADDSDDVTDYVADLHVANGQLTLSHSTHGADTVNDIAVRVMPQQKRSDSHPATHLYTGGATGGEAVSRDAEFRVAATWRVDRNEADPWTAPLDGEDEDGDPMQVFEEQASRSIGEDGWRTISIENVDQDGGRTVVVDLYSDYYENAQQAATGLTDAGQATALGTALSAGDGVPTVTVTAAVPDNAATTDEDESMPLFWLFGAGDSIADMDLNSDVIGFDSATFKDPGDLQPGERQELRPGDIDSTTDGDQFDEVAGTWRGIPGTYRCNATSGDTNCFIRNQLQSGVSFGGQWRFTPAAGAMIIDQDSDWLSAGVWLTIPDDEENGDYAGGAFVEGNDPFGVDDNETYQSDTLRNVLGTATYEGSAYGRYAENDDGAMRSDRFEADASLTAEFGDATALGSISGTVTGFVAEGGADSSTWDVNLDMASLGDTTSTGRFGGEVTAHSRGHDMDGVWAGQFFGSNNQGMVANPAFDDTQDESDTNRRMVLSGQPGSVGATFSASDRDANDDYSLTLIGVIGADWTEGAHPSTN